MRIGEREIEMGIIKLRFLHGHELVVALMRMERERERERHTHTHTHTRRWGRSSRSDFCIFMKENCSI
jgi:hypothetical protein